MCVGGVLGDTAYHIPKTIIKGRGILHLSKIMETQNNFKIGDIVGNFTYGYGTGEITEYIDGKPFVCWHEWSEANCCMDEKDLEIEPYGGFK